MRNSYVQSAVELLKTYVFTTAVLAIFVLIMAFPHYPESMSQWVWFLLLVTPVTCAILFVGYLLLNNKATRAVERATERKQFSFLRIGYGIVFLPLVFGGLYFLARAAEALFKAFF